ncbi:MAG TPA: molybdenum cofactor biosynthesis protein MoaE [Tepidisphaeraceae bacterium]|jgi:molybdopterin synthase catalytic subunit
MNDRIDITADPLDTAAAVAFVADPAAGGIDVFLGTTRSEKRADGADLVALDYEAYGDLARKQLAVLVASARAKWPVVKCVVLHRTGRVGLAEPSVVIAVSTPHRAASFEACRFLIDSLKQVAAIWKQEVWTDGTRTWVEGTEVRPEEEYKP